VRPCVEPPLRTPPRFSTDSSTGCTNGCEIVEKRKVRKLRALPVRWGCTAPCASLECRLRRARSASRSKPNLRAVREGRKAKAEGQQERWTKAKPARRIFLVRRWRRLSAKRTSGRGLGKPGGFPR